MNEIESSQMVIARLNENPFYQDYLKLKNVMNIGSNVEKMIQRQQQYIAELQAQAQQQAQQQQYQEPQDEFGEPMPQRPRQMAPPVPQQLPKAAPAGDPGRRRPAQQRQPAPAQEDIGIDEEPAIEGVPEWEKDE